MANISVPIYYAFTFPFTYTECQNQLEHFNLMHGKTDQEIDSILEILSRAVNKKEEPPTNQSIQEMDTLIPSEQIDESNENENKFSRKSPDDIYNDIYFHRELLIKSVEGRNVDLVTISSFHGIQSKTEDRLTNLFPDLNTRRSNVFKDKKVRDLSLSQRKVRIDRKFISRSFSYRRVSIRVKRQPVSFWMDFLN